MFKFVQWFVNAGLTGSILVLCLVSYSFAEDTEKISIINVPGLNVNVDLKALQNEGKLGVDYKILYDFIPENDRLDIIVTSNGYISNEKDKGANSIISQLKIASRFFDKKLQPLTAAEKARLLELLAKPPKDLTEDEKAELKKLMQVGKKRSYFVPEAHVNYETDQSFKDNQTAVGAGIGFDLESLPFIKYVIDIPFRILRPNNSKNGPSEPRYFIGYDYVSNSDIEARKALTTDSSYNRLTAQAAWSTYILDSVRLKALWQGYLEIDPPKEIKDAKLDKTSLIEVSASIPVGLLPSSMGTSQRIFVKYTDGKLPPTLKSSSQVSTGFSFEF